MSDDSQTADQAPDAGADEGPGCMPGILAALALAGILGFVFCGFMTWLIFQKQDELALRSIRGSVIPAIEQSLMMPEEKTKTVKLLNEFADELERDRLEGWQASGVMQRLSRLPMLQWGQMRRLETFIENHPEDFSSEDALQFDRIRKGIERDEITTIDCVHMLSPVLQSSVDQQSAPLVDELTVKAVADVVQRAKIIADRSDVEQQPKGDVSIDILVRRQIEAGIEQGSY